MNPAPGWRRRSHTRRVRVPLGRDVPHSCGKLQERLPQMPCGWDRALLDESLVAFFKGTLKCPRAGEERSTRKAPAAPARGRKGRSRKGGEGHNGSTGPREQGWQPPSGRAGSLRQSSAAAPSSVNLGLKSCLRCCSSWPRTRGDK